MLRRFRTLLALALALAGVQIVVVGVLYYMHTANLLFMISVSLCAAALAVLLVLRALFTCGWRGMWLLLPTLIALGPFVYIYLLIIIFGAADVD